MRSKKMSRRDFLKLAGLLSGIIVSGALVAKLQNTFTKISLLQEEDMDFLAGIASAVVEASRLSNGAKAGDFGLNTTGRTLILPDGRKDYPAFWIRDYAMSLNSGFITIEEQRRILLLTAENQQDEPWFLPTGSYVPPGAIPDHITLAGEPIFFPGTYSYSEQGDPRWGNLPPLDNPYHFIHMAATYVRVTNDVAILKEQVQAKSLLSRMEHAFAVPPSQSVLSLPYATTEERGVSWGFTDTVTHTGNLLFCSLLKYQAANELFWLCKKLQLTQKALNYERVARNLKRAIPTTFGIRGGLLRASTGKSNQPDVWGTAYAVYIGALDFMSELSACESLARGYRDGTISWHGNIRHVPTNEDFSPTTAWEICLVPKNTYQNGAYWGTPTGWVCYAIAQVDFDLARRLATEYVEELKEGDFRKGRDFGSPWECMYPQDYRLDPVYMTSVTCPLAAFKRLERENNW